MRSRAEAVRLVVLLYRLLLGREPDDGGLRHYVDQIRRGVDTEDVAGEIAQSEEASRRLLRSRALVQLGHSQWRDLLECREIPRLFFLHIMKTGGTALRRGLCRSLPPGLCLTDVLLDDLVVLPRHVLRGAIFITGHLPLESLEVLAPDVAVLRDPVERTISHYWHLSRQASVRQEQPDFSLDLFLRSPRWRSLSANYQARYLVHRIGIVDAWVRFSPVERFAQLGPPFPASHQHPLQSLFDSTAIAEFDGDLAELAQAKLDGIQFVGVTEALDVLFRRVTQYWGVVDPEPLAHENVASDRPSVDDLPSSTIELIREVNQVDLLLYEQAKRRSCLNESGSGGRRVGNVGDIAVST
jgi:hypothetical protein